MMALGQNMVTTVPSQLKTSLIAIGSVLAILIGVIIAVGVVNTANDTPQVGLDVGNLAPDFVTTSLLGEPIRLWDLRGQVVILNFWATWCGPCRIEMPIFEHLYAEFHPQAMTIIAVNNRETAEEMARFRDQIGMSFPLALDENGSIQEMYAIGGYPITFVIDREGIIIQKHFGVFTPRQAETLRSLLASQSAPHQSQ